MVSQQTINALWGAMRLARFDARGLELMTGTRQGFFNSFWAAAAIAPFFLLFLGLKWKAGFIEVEAFRFVAVEFSVYVMSWVLFPLVMVHLTRHMGWWPNYYTYGTARNWTVLVQNLLYLPIAMADVSGLITLGVSVSLLQLVFIYMLIYSWFVARRGLGITGLAASGVVALDLVLAMLINLPATMLLR